MLFLSSLIFQLIFFLNMFILILIWLPGLFMRRQISQELGRTWGRTSLWLLDKICNLKIERRGLEHIQQGSLIVAAKHQSMWETFVLPIHFSDFSYILKHELIWLPFFGWYLLAAQQIAIDRAKGGKLLPQLIDKAKKLSAESIKSLFKTGFFKDVRLEQDGSTLVVIVEERPSISSVKIEGNKDISTDDLKKALFPDGSPATPAEFKERFTAYLDKILKSRDAAKVRLVIE